MKELILVQGHPMDPAKTIKVGAILLRDIQEDFKVFL